MEIAGRKKHRVKLKSEERAALRSVVDGQGSKERRRAHEAQRHAPAHQVRAGDPGLPDHAEVRLPSFRLGDNDGE